MPGDFSRTTFDPLKHFSAVLMQQGRVQVDADWNEQRDLLVHLVRSLARDVIGPHGGPDDGFDIGPAVDDGTVVPYQFSIAPGHYYVDGVLCENDAPGPVWFGRQPDAVDDEVLEAGHRYLVYLHAWEQEITAVQDDSIREVALKGPDTCARLRVVWQVRVLDADEVDEADPMSSLRRLRPALSTGRLRARARQEEPSDQPCSLSPDARYRGPENQLYRVQIHRGGELGAATFVWSRDNAAVDIGVTGVHDSSLTVQDLGPDDRRSVHPGDWVEVVDDGTVLDHQVADLHQVREVDLVDRRVTLDDAAPVVDTSRHPLLRRWDHGRAPYVELTDGAIAVSEGEWLTLEHGVQVRFEELGATYQAGDYWQIPARTATGDVEWPGPADAPEATPPRGVHQHTAPLALITVDTSSVTVSRTYRRTIEPIATPD